MYVATAQPVNSVSVSTAANKIMHHPWNFGGLNSSFSWFGGLASPISYVEPPLLPDPLDPARCY